MNTTKNALKIYEYKNPSSMLFIQFVPPHIEINRSYNTESVSIVGRNFPYKQYSGGDRDISFALDFYTEQPDGLDVMKKIRQLESWTMNQTYQEGLKVLMIEFGGIFLESKWILKSIDNLKLLDFDEKLDYNPRRATLTAVFSQYVDKEIKRNDFLYGNF